jgi:uncharacterized repeat protein (TIGR01451 family)
MKNPTLLLIALSLASVLATPVAVAANAVEIDSSALREVEQKTLDGSTSVALREIKSAQPGDRVRFVLRVHNGTAKPADRIVVTNPVPSDVEFQAASPGAEVSVDGGRTFGALAQLTVKPLAGTPRAAQVTDVTHVRWRLASSVAPGADSELFFAGRVR